MEGEYRILVRADVNMTDENLNDIIQKARCPIS
jgi:hypothetical protein